MSFPPPAGAGGGKKLGVASEPYSPLVVALGFGPPS